MRAATAMLLMLLSGLALAQEGAQVDDFSQNPKAALLLASLKNQYGFAESDLFGVKSALREANRLPQLIHSEQNSKEKVLTWDEYRPLHVNSANIANGLRFMREQRPWLARAEAEYGVPAVVVTALIGVETKYGTYTGRYRVLDALATLGFDHPTRAPFFFDQLTQFFVLCRESHIDPATPVGSYAGAMGDAQFMPGVYRTLAVDFDGDGRKNLWSAPDAIGSVANYLVHYDAARSWRRGGAVLAGLRAGCPPPPSQLQRNGKLPDQSVASLHSAGIDAAVNLPQDLPAGLLQLDLNNGAEYWIALPNFYSLMSYNPRVYYAMAVVELADALEKAARSEPPPVAAR